ncbi:DUF952 domain-containing protein, partial [Streptomyces parvus]|uniref:DUF952 domain-containing protein n=1 Tax=Streptomyces parvus TaxID=66428 RepID=UPI00363A929A
VAASSPARTAPNPARRRGDNLTPERAPPPGPGGAAPFDPGRLADPVRYEAMKPGGEKFPHLYGPLPVGAVVEVRRFADWHHDRREEDEPQ